MTMINPWFDSEGDLTDEGIALWVDHIDDPTRWPLPGDVAGHGESCLFCKERIVALSLLVRAEDPPLEEFPAGEEEGFVTHHMPVNVNSYRYVFGGS